MYFFKIIIAGGRCWLYPKSLGAWLRFFQVLYNLLIKRYKIYIRNKTVQITYILRSERFAFDRVKIPGLRTLRVHSSENTGGGTLRVRSCENTEGANASRSFYLNLISLRFWVRTLRVRFNFTSFLSALHFLLDFIFSLHRVHFFYSLQFTSNKNFFFTLRF